MAMKTATAVPGRKTEPARDTPARKRPRGGPLEVRRRRTFWPFLLPALLLYLVFFLGPALASFWVSLHEWDGITEMEWKGLENYEILLGDSVFHTAFTNTLILLIGGGIVVFVVSFALTMVLRDMRGKKFVRSVLFFPNIISPIVLSILWGFIFQSGGLLNTGLAGLGIDDAPQWLLDHPFTIVFLGIVWVQIGLYITILMAAVDQIPPNLYEECELAGANAWQRFRHVTLPLTWEVVAASSILWTIASLKIFEFIFAFGGTTGDMPRVGIWNTALFVYGNTFGGRTPAYDFGYASAAAVVTLLTIIAFVIVLRRLMRRDSVEF